MWKFEPVEFSLLNDKTFTLISDFGLMQRYSSHLFLVLISGPLFFVSAFINVKKLIPLLFGIFIITILVGGFGFYFSDRVSLLWGWYAYGTGVLIINTAIATKLFPGLYEQQVSKNQVVEEQEGELSEEDDEIDEDLMEYKQLEDSDEIQTPSDGKEFFLSIYKELFREIYSNEEISVKFKEDYLLKTLRKNPQFLDITTENPVEIEKIIASWADELIENALKIDKEQKETAASSPSCKIYSDSGLGGPTEVGKFERGIIYSTNRIPGKYYSGPKEVGFIERDIIYSTNRIPGKFYIGPTKVGYIDGGKVYSTSASGGSARQVGKYDGGSACGAAAAYLLLF
jgi:hypothetical protein